MLALARQAGVPAVLTNAVRYLTPGDAVTADVLDAARRLVPLDERHLDRVSAEGYLASGDRMAAVARAVAEAVGDPRAADELHATTESLAGRCRLDLHRDLGIGTVRFPEPRVLGYGPAEDLDTVLRARCEARIGTVYPGASEEHRRLVRTRLRAELSVVATTGYASYFLTVARVRDMIRDRGIRVAARGSGAGSLVNHLLGISGVDPIRHGLLMERFLSPARTELPDIDLDVESHRREEAHRAILDVFGPERVAAVSMMDTYRVRQAIRDVGAALGLPPNEIGTMATSFPRLRARDIRRALAELPELREAGLDADRIALLLDLVERLDGLPRHVALHPCGVILSDSTLLERTPVELSEVGMPMSQFDKDDVEAFGLVKLDVLGVRMQSAMSYALEEIARVDGPEAAPAGHHPRWATTPERGYLDPDTGRIDLDAVPRDDERTFELIRSTRTLGVFQIESPGQRGLLGAFAPRTFADLIIDISLFRPGPVNTDMITPFLMARQGWEKPRQLHSRLEPVLRETHGVVVFHEQVLRLITATTGCTLAEADEARRALSDRQGRAVVRDWWGPLAASQGYDAVSRDRIWQVLEGFGAFGFCKAHAAAFAVPTYQSAWLKAHHPAAFFAGILTHDPGMYPKRLLLADARHFGIAVLPLDVNASGADFRVERHHPMPRARSEGDGYDYGIRIALSEVKGITSEEITRIVRGRPYRSLPDFWHRAAPRRPVAERLVIAGAFDSLHAVAAPAPAQPGGRVTRRDLLLHVAELDRWSRSSRRDVSGGPVPSRPGQLLLDLGPVPGPVPPAGLPELTEAERVRAELDILGLDVSGHTMDLFAPLLDDVGVTRSRELRDRRNRADLLVAGVKVSMRALPVRSGRRAVFLTLDDSTGPVDIAFFGDVPGRYAAAVFHSRLFLVRGVLRRTGARGVSLRATGVWDLPSVWRLWNDGGPRAVLGLVHAGAGPGGHGSRPGGSVLEETMVREQDRETTSGLPVGDRARTRHTRTDLLRAASRSGQDRKSASAAGTDRGPRPGNLRSPGQAPSAGPGSCPPGTGPYAPVTAVPGWTALESGRTADRFTPRGDHRA
jgi:error-prone DNA polymerase